MNICSFVGLLGSILKQNCDVLISISMTLLTRCCYSLHHVWNSRTVLDFSADFWKLTWQYELIYGITSPSTAELWTGNVQPPRQNECWHWILHELLQPFCSCCNTKVFLNSFQLCAADWLGGDPSGHQTDKQNRSSQQKLQNWTLQLQKLDSMQLC